MLIKELFQILNSRVEYAVLRDYNDLPNSYSSRDIDILIRRECFKLVSNDILKLVENSNCKILLYYESDRMITLVLGKTSQVGLDLIQVDFLFKSSLYGLVILTPEQMLADRVFNGRVYHVSAKIEFLDKYLYFKMLNQSYPDKNLALLDKMRTSQDCVSFIRSNLGIDSFRELEDISSKILRKLILRRNIKTSLVVHLSSRISFAFYYLKNSWRYKGMSIGFTGPDGSGKTTVINGLLKEISAIFPNTSTFHFRPRILPNLGRIVSKAHNGQIIDEEFSQPHRAKEVGNLNSFIRLLYYSGDYILGYFWRIRSELRKRRIVIFDRYFTDIIVDSRRMRISLGMPLLLRFYRIFIPKLDYIFLLTAESRIILKRKKGVNIRANNGD